MSIHLTVIEPFGDYVRGSRITDDKEVKKVLGSENAARVVKVAAPPEKSK